eukprot:scaffold544_cov256-Pinguiococcus_pyrenoidosus.AAC.16
MAADVPATRGFTATHARTRCQRHFRFDLSFARQIPSSRPSRTERQSHGLLAPPTRLSSALRA